MEQADYSWRKEFGGVRVDVAKCLNHASVSQRLSFSRMDSLTISSKRMATSSAGVFISFMAQPFTTLKPEPEM
jgi:hypothetical protein